MSGGRRTAGEYVSGHAPVTLDVDIGPARQQQRDHIRPPEPRGLDQRRLPELRAEFGWRIYR